MRSSDSTIRKYLNEHVEIADLVTQYEFGYLRNLIETLFTLNLNGFSLEQKTLSILSTLFEYLVKGFQFRKFVAKIGTPKERQKFLTTLLYHIYALKFPVQWLRSQERLEIALYSLLAHVATNSTLKSIYKSFPYSTQMKAIGFLFAFYDEGAFRILSTIRNSKLIDLINRGMIPRDALWNWAEGMPVITRLDIADFIKQATVHVKEKSSELAQKIGSTKAEVAPLVELFGLYGNQLPETEEGFVQTAQGHIKALTKSPTAYKAGFDRIVHALPTRGKKLAWQYWLESTLQSFQALSQYIDVSNHPILVFDQSDPALFNKNAYTIFRLKERYGIEVFHIDIRTTTHLAKKLDCLELIATDQGGHFGYGGARNAIFLLAPTLHAIYQAKKYSKTNFIKNVLTLSKETLKGFFKEGQKYFIHMGDDDLYVPPSAAFSDALWAYEHGDDYVCRWGYIEGRCTSDINFTPHAVMKYPEKILAECFWLPEPSPHGMSGILSKTKLCLSLPFGQEEHHLLCLHHELSDFRKSALHLGGFRYPETTSIPTTRYAGLAKHLSKMTQDAFERLLVTELIDPNNRYQSCALPWNTSNIELSSFQMVLKYLQEPKIVEDMQSTFWKNVRRNAKAFQEPHPDRQELLSSEALEALIRSDLKKEFPTMPPELVAYFRKLKEQAIYYKEFLQLVALNKKDAVEKARRAIESKSHRPIQKLPFANALYKLCQVIGEAGFQKALSKLLKP